MDLLKNRSCLTSFLEFLEKVISTLDTGKPVDIIYLDFVKAFNKVPYQKLLKKLLSHGNGCKIFTWIESWLVGRRQKVSLNRGFFRLV